MKTKVYLIICGLFLACSYTLNAQVAFTGGAIQGLTVCENAAATSIDTLLQVSDTSTGDTVTWSIVIAPAHGTLVATYTAISTPGTLTPTGLTYMPAPGYSGSDMFAVRFADSLVYDTTTVNVSVDTALNPGSIISAAAVCLHTEIALLDATTGGVWSISNGRASITGTDSVTGVSAGMDTIRYSLTNVCGTVSAMQIITVNAVPNAGRLPAPDSVCAGGSLRLMTGGDAGGIWLSSNLVSATVNDTGLVTGTAPGPSTIMYIVTNGCGSDTASVVVKVQEPVSPIIATGDTVCQFQMLTLLDLSAGGAWTSSSFFVAAVIDGIVVGVTPGTATITYTLTNSCGATTATEDVTVLSTAQCASGVNEVSNAKDELHIFPNPNNGAFTLSLSSGTNKEATVVITNIVGETIKQFTTLSNQETEVQLNSPAGLYFVKVSTPDGLYTTKVMVN